MRPTPWIVSMLTASPTAIGRSTGSPTVMIGFRSFRRDNSSSSSHLCKLWRTRIGPGHSFVHRWVCCGEPGVQPGSRSTGGLRAPGCPPLSTGYPPVIHRLSPQTCGSGWTSSGSFSPEPSTACPQVTRPRWTERPTVPRHPQASTTLSPDFLHRLWVTGRKQCVVIHSLWATSCGQRVGTCVVTASMLWSTPRRESTCGHQKARPGGPSRAARARTPLRCSA